MEYMSRTSGIHGASDGGSADCSPAWNGVKKNRGKHDESTILLASLRCRGDGRQQAGVRFHLAFARWPACTARCLQRESLVARQRCEPLRFYAPVRCVAVYLRAV